jgi:hypothetical protein
MTPRKLRPRPEDFTAPSTGAPDPDRVYWLNKPPSFPQQMDNAEERQRIWRISQGRWPAFLPSRKRLPF